MNSPKSNASFASNSSATQTMDNFKLYPMQTLNNLTDLKYSLQYVFATEHQIPQLSVSPFDCNMIPPVDQPMETTVTPAAMPAQVEQAPEFVDMSTYFGQMQSDQSQSMDGLESFLMENSCDLASAHPTRAIVETKPLNGATMSITDELNAALSETSQAIEMSMASEVEMPTPWIDTTITTPKTVYPTEKLLPSCIAIPTGIPTYVDIPFQMSTAASSYMMSESIVQPVEQTQQQTQMMQSVVDNGIIVKNNTLNDQMKNINEISVAEIDEIVADRAATTLEETTDFPSISTQPKPTDVVETKSEPNNKLLVSTLNQSDENLVDRLLLETRLQNSTAPPELETDDAFLNDLLMSIDGVPSNGNVLMSQQYENRENSSQIPNAILGESTDEMMIVRTDSIFHSPKPKSTDENVASTSKSCAECLGDSKCCKSEKSTAIEEVLVPRNSRAENRTINDAMANAIISSLIGQVPQPNTHVTTTGNCCSNGGRCTCKSPQEGLNNGCCVVICLKTLEQLRQVFRNSSTFNLIRCSSSGGVVG